MRKVFRHTGAKLARARRADLDGELFDFFVDILLGRHRGMVEDELVARFQQVTGPVMAKGVEDTTFYTYNRLTALNEVGGNPGRFGVSPEEFHDGNAHTARHWPGTLLATSTHDTKRAEDTRARIALLSEIPTRFAGAVSEWSSLNDRHRADPSLPDRNAEWLLYQTLIGAWPLSAAAAELDAFVGRIQRYMHKALREAKTHVSWINQRPEYDQGVERFVAAGVPKEQIAFQRDTYVFKSDGSPSELVGDFRDYYGPTYKAFRALDEDAQTALRRDLVALANAQNTSKTGAFRVPSDYVEVVAVKAR